MRPLHIQVVTDAGKKPTAVLIDYDDWITIQHKLSIETDYDLPQQQSINQHSGSIKLKQDPLNFQDRMRGEW